MKAKKSKSKNKTAPTKSKAKKKPKLSKREVDHIMDRTQVILGYEQKIPSVFELSVNFGTKTPKQDGVKIVDKRTAKKR